VTAAARAAHRLGPVDQVPPGEGREFEVAGRRIAVFRLRSGWVAATDAACPHRGGPLADGIVGMNSVVCPLHGRRFALAGGEAGDDDCRLVAHPARVEEGEIVVDLADAAS
jgi:nitrite reductase (NADH) small subunit